MIKKFQNLLRLTYSKKTIEGEYNDKLMKLDKGDKFYEIKLQTLKTERLSSLEAAEKIDQNK